MRYLRVCGISTLFTSPCRQQQGSGDAAAAEEAMALEWTWASRGNIWWTNSISKWNIVRTYSFSISGHAGTLYDTEIILVKLYQHAHIDVYIFVLRASEQNNQSPQEDKENRENDIQRAILLR